MKNSNRNIKIPVTVVVPTRNAESTIVKTLEGIEKQTYPVVEVIVIDNVSTDTTVKIVKQFARSHKKIHIRVIVNKENLMVARSFNNGIRAAKTPLIVAMHGDCMFATSNELSVLVKPLLTCPSVIATYGFTENPLWIWEQYSFWEKCLFAPDTGRSTPGLVGKIDCYRKEFLLSIAGYDEHGYANYGGEDADLHMRLKHVGNIIQTNARVYHLHYLHKDFSLRDWVAKKKATAETYGRLLRTHGRSIGIAGIAAFLAKPILAIGVLVPPISLVAFPLLVVFPFWYYRRMFTTASTLHDVRILLLPFIGILLVYYETFWIIHALLQDVPRSYGNA